MCREVIVIVYCSPEYFRFVIKWIAMTEQGNPDHQYYSIPPLSFVLVSIPCWMCVGKHSKPLVYLNLAATATYIQREMTVQYYYNKNSVVKTRGSPEQYT